MIVFLDIKDGKVELTKEELKKLLEERYQEGYAEGSRKIPYYFSYTCPYGYLNCPRSVQYITTADSSDLTISTSDTSNSFSNLYEPLDINIKTNLY